MFKKIKEFFFGKPAADEVVPQAPYKVEAPAFKPTADAAPIEVESVSAVAKTTNKKTSVAVKKSAAPKKATTPRKPRAPKP